MSFFSFFNYKRRKRELIKIRKLVPSVPALFIFTFFNFLIKLNKFKFHFLIFSFQPEYTGFYQFKSYIDYNVSDFTLEYYDPNKNRENCPICNFEPNNTANFPKSDSTPRDLIVTYATYRSCNFAIYQRTLRTTKSNASLVVFFDKNAFKKTDQDTLNFAKSCGTQIILIPNAPFECSNSASKNYVFPIILEFLRLNQNRINRVIFLDLFDSLFQNDPFNGDIPKYEVHMMREHIQNKHNRVMKRWMKDALPNYTTPHEFDDKYTINSGYFASSLPVFSTFINAFCKYARIGKYIDQAIYAYLSMEKMLDLEGCPIVDFKPMEERITHFSYKDPDRPFPYIAANFRNDIPATVLHITYCGNDNFRKSILKVCPRPTKNMNNYLDKDCFNVTAVEQGLEEWEPLPSLHYGKCMRRW